MKIYQSADGRFIYFNGVEKVFFNTEQEAIRIMSKANFVEQIQATATQIAQAADRLDDLITVFFDRGYGVGGAQEIQDEDIAAQGVTAAQVAGVITLGQQLANFRNNAAVVTGDYDAILNAARTDV